MGLACKTLLYALHALFDTLLLTKDKCFNKGDEATQTLMTNTFQYLVTIKVFILPKLMLVIRTVFILLKLAVYLDFGVSLDSKLLTSSMHS